MRKRDGRKLRQQGSVTVFAALSFMLVAALICALTESARVQGARVMVAMAANMALDNLFSTYERELLDKYGILLFDGAAGGTEVDQRALEQSLEESMNYNLDTDSGMYVVKGQDFYGVTVESVSVDRVITADAAYGLVWRSMINDYAKLDYSAQLMETLLGIGAMNEKNEKLEMAVERMDECYETAADISLAYLDLIERLDGIQCNSRGIDFGNLKVRTSYVKAWRSTDEVSREQISIDHDGVYQAVSSQGARITLLFQDLLGLYEQVVKGDASKVGELIDYTRVARQFFMDTRNAIERCIGIIENIRGDQEGLKGQIASATVFLEGMKDSLLEEDYSGLIEELSIICSQDQQMEERFENLGEIYDILIYDRDLVQQILDYCPSLAGIKEDSRGAGEVLPYYEDYLKAEPLLRQYRTDGMYLSYEGLECREEDGSILGCVYDYVQSGICRMVIPKDSEISAKKINVKGLADMYGVRGEREEYIEDMANDLINEALFGLYLGDHFDSFTDTDGSGLLDYQLEYILFGKASDKENLTKAITAVAGIRLGFNLAHIYTDSGKKQEAYSIALAALGFTGIMALVKALQYTILTAWAVGETVMDLKTLMKGGCVPLLKKKEEWNLSLSNLLAGNLTLTEEEKEESGLAYNDYLSCVMLLSDGQDKAFRSMSAVELYMIGAGVSDFRLRNYVYGMEITVTYRAGSKKQLFTEHCSYTY